MRTCGGCTLCCKLLPLEIGGKVNGVDLAGSYHKAAGERCKFQRSGHGCRIYERRPWSCKIWNCRWLVNNDTADLSRPDRSGYVIDISPDFVTIVNGETGERTSIQVVQIWVDPDRRDAHRDPALRAYLERRGAEGIAALIRYSATEAFTIIPPAMSQSGEWIEFNSNIHREKTHTPQEIATALGGPFRFGFSE